MQVKVTVAFTVVYDPGEPTVPTEEFLTALRDNIQSEPELFLTAHTAYDVIVAVEPQP